MHWSCSGFTEIMLHWISGTFLLNFLFASERSMGKGSRLLAHVVSGICYDSSRCHSFVGCQLNLQINPEGFLWCPEAEGFPVLSLHVSSLWTKPGLQAGDLQKPSWGTTKLFSNEMQSEAKRLRHLTVYTWRRNKHPPSDFNDAIYFFCLHWENLERTRGWIVPNLWFIFSSVTLPLKGSAILQTDSQVCFCTLVLLTKVGEGWDTRVAQSCSTWFRNK